MDHSSTRNKTPYWQHQQDVNQTTKPHIKVIETHYILF